MMLQHFYNESIPHPPSEKKRYQHISFSKKKKITEDSGELIKCNKMIKTCSYIQHLVINLKH